MAAEAKQKPEAKENKGKKAKPPGEAPVEAPAAEAPKAPPPPRSPADPRLKALKKLQSKLLPKGALRDRYKALMARWDSGDDHGGVTVQELKALFDDRKTRS